jgi:hypothetical protein
MKGVKLIQKPMQNLSFSVFNIFSDKSLINSEPILFSRRYGNVKHEWTRVLISL